MDATSVLLLRGIVGIAAGMLAMLWPGLTIAFLVVLFGVYALVDGVTNVSLGLRRTPERGRSWASVAQGLFGIAAGVLAFVWPGITTLALLFWIAAWAIITGILEVVAAIRFRKELQREWILVLSGVLSIAFGVLLSAFPAVGAVGLAWALGAYAAASGILLVAVAIRLRTGRLVTA
jgi:uncharacterized membrane protein HdeD (DUF308 family)